jgi:hypothetical protein
VDYGRSGDVLPNPRADYFVLKAQQNPRENFGNCI